jgi:hypothetical protein
VSGFSSKSRSNLSGFKAEKANAAKTIYPLDVMRRQAQFMLTIKDILHASSELLAS